jgi:mannitol/fructose-specific phosphotransferase system IIA component (Ntr-type)
MQLISLLEPKLIYFDTNSDSKTDALKIMVDLICKHYETPRCRDDLFELVLKREQESSTVYPTGLAIPHVRIDNFDDTVICACIPRKPITENGQLIKIIFLIITDNSSAKLYLNIVSALIRMSRDSAVMAQILAQKDGHGVYHVIKQEDYKVKEDLTVKDIMTTSPATIRDTATIKELAELLSSQNIVNLPVVNDKNEFVGEVDILQYLKVGVPDYLMLMNNLKFLPSFEPFEQLYSKEDEVLIKDIMTGPELNLYPDNSIIEAVFRMIQHKKTFFAVTENKKVVGTLTAGDIFRKVVRA